jgi:hypothetical protein
MCNGYKHHDGCECGFGPPYLGSKKNIPGNKGDSFVIRERKRENWVFKGIVDKNKIANSLGELGLNKKWQDSILKSYSQAGYPIKESLWKKFSDGQQRGAAQKMMRALGLREELVEELEPIHLEIPLFRLQPPRTEKSKVTYEERLARTNGWSVAVKVPGFATGTDLSMYLEGKGVVWTSKDECKIIVLPVVIKRRRVNVFLGKVCIAKNKMVAEAGNQKTGQIFNRTIISCKEYISPSPSALMIVEYDLLKNRYDNVKFYLGWGKKMKRNAEFTIPIKGITPGIQISVTIDSEIQLEFDLEPKHDYRLYPIPEGIGISWKVSKRKPAAGRSFNTASV